MRKKFYLITLVVLGVLLAGTTTYLVIGGMKYKALSNEQKRHNEIFIKLVYDYAEVLSAHPYYSETNRLPFLLSNPPSTP